MDRRCFIKASTLFTVTALSGSRMAIATVTEQPILPDADWRVFEVVTRVELANTEGDTRVWLPLPSVEDASWIKPMGNLWQGNAVNVQLEQEQKYGARMLVANWDGQVSKPVVELTSRFATRDRATDFARPENIRALDRSTAKLYTSATTMLPTDGIVKKTALDITRNAKTDEAKARAIYDWIVENTTRNPKTRGCGIGNIRGMLESGDLSGKCADLNALYVGLARAVGLPARDVYGIRVADSKFGYKSLGKSGDISKAQHCRAEVWLKGFGWVAVDPADVRKVLLEELSWPQGKNSLVPGR
jgi:transglutaminase-like putative cysteine protease